MGESACEQVTTGSAFSSDKLQKLHEFFWSITEQSTAKPMKANVNYFWHSLKTALVSNDFVWREINLS